MSILFILAFSYLIGKAASKAAVYQGRSPRTWFWIGFWFGPLGFLTLFLLPRRPPSPPHRAAPRTPPVLSPRAKEDEGLLWHYLDMENAVMGPMSLQALSRAWHEGSVAESTYVWTERMADWMRLSDALLIPQR